MMNILFDYAGEPGKTSCAIVIGEQRIIIEGNNGDPTAVTCLLLLECALYECMANGVCSVDFIDLKNKLPKSVEEITPMFTTSQYTSRQAMARVGAVVKHLSNLEEFISKTKNYFTVEAKKTGNAYSGVVEIRVTELAEPYSFSRSISGAKQKTRLPQEDLSEFFNWDEVNCRLKDDWDILMNQIDNDSDSVSQSKGLLEYDDFQEIQLIKPYRGVVWREDLLDRFAGKFAGIIDEELLPPIDVEGKRSTIDEYIGIVEGALEKKCSSISIIEGTSGSGKTFALLRVFSKLRSAGHYPILVQMGKKINSSRRIISFISKYAYSTLSETNTVKQMFSSLAPDKIGAVLVDGFDEITIQEQEDVMREINEILKWKLPNLIIIITTHKKNKVIKSLKNEENKIIHAGVKSLEISDEYLSDIINPDMLSRHPELFKTPLVISHVKLLKGNEKELKTLSYYGKVSTTKYRGYSLNIKTLFDLFDVFIEYQIAHCVKEGHDSCIYSHILPYLAYESFCKTNDRRSKSGNRRIDLKWLDFDRIDKESVAYIQIEGNANDYWLYTQKERLQALLQTDFIKEENGEYRFSHYERWMFLAAKHAYLLIKHGRNEEREKVLKKAEELTRPLNEDGSRNQDAPRFLPYGYYLLRFLCKDGLIVSDICKMLILLIGLNVGYDGKYYDGWELLNADNGFINDEKISDRKNKNKKTESKQDRNSEGLLPSYFKSLSWRMGRYKDKTSLDRDEQRSLALINSFLYSYITKKRDKKEKEKIINKTIYYYQVLIAIELKRLILSLETVKEREKREVSFVCNENDLLGNSEKLIKLLSLINQKLDKAYEELQNKKKQYKSSKSNNGQEEFTPTDLIGMIESKKKLPKPSGYYSYDYLPKLISNIGAAYLEMAKTLYSFENIDRVKEELDWALQWHNKCFEYRTIIKRINKEETKDVSLIRSHISKATDLFWQEKYGISDNGFNEAIKEYKEALLLQGIKYDDVKIMNIDSDITSLKKRTKEIVPEQGDAVTILPRMAGCFYEEWGNCPAQEKRKWAKEVLNCIKVGIAFLVCEIGGGEMNDEYNVKYILYSDEIEKLAEDIKNKYVKVYPDLTKEDSRLMKKCIKKVLEYYNAINGKSELQLNAEGDGISVSDKK